MRAARTGVLRRDCRGGVSAELALVLPIFLSCVIGIMEFGRMLYVENALQQAAEAAARCASIDATNCGSAASTQTYAVSRVALAVPSNTFTATVAACGNRVSASYPYDYMTSFLPLPALTLTAQACFPK